MEVTSIKCGSPSFTVFDSTGLHQRSPADGTDFNQRLDDLTTMTFNDIHQEEAQQTDHDRSVQELAGVAPPCSDCGKRERVDGDLCEICAED